MSHRTLFHSAPDGGIPSFRKSGSSVNSRIQLSSPDPLGELAVATAVEAQQQRVDEREDEERGQQEHRRAEEEEQGEARPTPATRRLDAAASVVASGGLSAVIGPSFRCGCRVG